MPVASVAGETLWSTLAVMDKRDELWLRLQALPMERRERARKAFEALLPLVKGIASDLREAYAEAGQPYGDSDEGLLRWFHEAPDHDETPREVTDLDAPDGERAALTEAEQQAWDDIVADLE